MSGKPWKPHEASRVIIDRAMEHVESVPYTVSARWLFYCLLQDGTFSDKKDYLRFKDLLAKARKRFYGEWRPDTLADETRRALYLGDGYSTPEDWLKCEVATIECRLDLWQGLPQYAEIWFEAKAMQAQFLYYTKNVTLRPFGGDPSIPMKWQIAKDLEDMYSRDPEREIVILYFGDLDAKGEEIPKSATGDIEEWCEAPFRFERCGLNPGHEIEFNLPENIDHAGAYQWEALADSQAERLIKDSLKKHVDVDGLENAAMAAKTHSQRFRREILTMANRWEAAM